jgi:hypothetical protein
LQRKAPIGTRGESRSKFGGGIDGRHAALPIGASPNASLPSQADTWDQEFEQLEQEMDSTVQQLRDSNSIFTPSIDWTNELFQQRLDELNGLLQSLESPQGVNFSEHVNQLHYGTF